MANAIITEEFRKNQANLLIADITKTQEADHLGYYIGIGKSDRWGANDVAPAPTGSKIEKEDVINNLIALARIEEAAICKLAIKTNQEWASGRKFKVYDPGDLTCFNSNTVADVRGCYCYYEEKVYLCLGNGAGGQSVGSAVAVVNPPDGQATVLGDPGENTGGDGYIWVLIGDFIANSEFTDSTTFFELPVALTVGTANANTARDASAGLIHGFAIRNEGSGYTPTTGTATKDAKLRFTKLDGTNATANVKVEIIDGKVKRVLAADGEDFALADFEALGLGASNGATQGRASVSITGAGNPTTSAAIDVLIGPSVGYGVDDNLEIFPPFFLGLTYDFTQNTTGDTLTDISFRQVSIIKNPQRANDLASTTSGTNLDSPGNDFDWGGADTSTNTLDSLRSVPVSSGTLPALGTGVTSEGYYMVDESSGEQAWVDYIDNTANEERIYFHQNSSFTHTGEASPNQFNGSLGDPWPATASNIKMYDAGGNEVGTSIVVGAISEPEHVENTGEVIFLENRSGIRRTSAQTEKVRIILQL